MITWQDKGGWRDDEAVALEPTGNGSYDGLGTDIKSNTLLKHHANEITVCFAPLVRTFRQITGSSTDNVV